MIDKHQRSNNKPRRNEDGQGRRRLTRITNNKLETTDMYFTYYVSSAPIFLSFSLLIFLSTTIWARRDDTTLWARRDDTTLWARRDDTTLWARRDDTTLWAKRDDPTLWARRDDTTLWARRDDYLTLSSGKEPTFKDLTATGNHSPSPLSPITSPPHTAPNAPSPSLRFRTMFSRGISHSSR